MSSWSKQPVIANNAPKAIGPYSVAVKAGPFLFVSGQLGLDPATGDLVSGGVAAETRQALTNLKAILEAAGCGLDTVVKTTVFLRDMGEFSTMNQVYNEFFAQNPPARSAIQAAALPRGAAVEIEAIALLPEDEG